MAGSESDVARLRARIDAYAFDRPGEVATFERRLRKEHGWSADLAARAIVEYRRFVLLAVCAGHPVSPPPAVDKVWHLHLTDTRRYWQEFCPEVLGQPLHHEPSRGGAEDAARFEALYRQTLQSYDRLIGQAPPRDIWPSGSAAASGRLARIAGMIVRHRRALTGRRWPGLSGAGVLATTLLVTGCAAIYNSSAPGGIPGPEFLEAYLPALAAAVVVTGVLQVLMASARPRPKIDQADLGAYELAYLSGKRSRVLETALLRLHQLGHIQFSRAGRRLELATSLRDEAPPIEHAVAGAIRSGKLKPSGAVSRALGNLRWRLEKAGLQTDGKTRLWGGMIALALVGPLVLLGAARLYFGMAGHRQTGILVMALLLVVAVTLIMSDLTMDRTRWGRRMRDDARRTTPSPGRLAPDDPLLPRSLALYGVGALAAGMLGDFKAFVRTQLAQDSSGGGCGGGGGGGCGGGCGG